MALRLALLGCAAAFAWAAPSVSLSQQAGRAKVQDRTITQVVKLLQDLMEKSKAEGDTERELFAKHKCYCDTNEAAKNEEIERLTQEIGLLESSIEELQAATGKLSEEVAKLSKEMAENEASRNQAQAIRDKENKDFLATEADLTQAIDQMKQAIDVLTQVGADQTLGAAADHKKYMAGQPSLAAVKTTVRKAMLAAMAFASEKQTKTLGAFVQAPFTGTYVARSGEVVGILKDMRDTFSANLAAAIQREKEAAAAHEKYMATMLEAFNVMEASYNTKQSELSSNDGILAGKKGELTTAQEQLAEAQDFLSKLIPMCADKKTQYDERVALRASEQAAISEAIAILNSDAAFETFGKVGATSTGSTGAASFVQIRQHRFLKREQPQEAAAAFLQRRARGAGGSALGKVIALLKANNPFAVVLEEISKMISLLDQEQKADDDQKAWCEAERTKTNTDIDAKNGAIVALTGEIDALVAAIEDPQTGLKDRIKSAETEKEANYENQVATTKERKADNANYQADVGHLVEAQALLQRAVVVLTNYYKKLTQELQAGLIQKGKRDDPAPPATWEDTYKGQSEGGNNVITMLEFILSETKKEEMMAHEQERQAQHDFEDTMQSLKDEELSLSESLAAMHLQLAEKEKTLIEKRDDRERTQKEVAALEAYLEQIKPGCDFITTNAAQRTANRAEEKQALEQAVTFLKGTPAYRDAMEAAHQESLGKCREVCNVNEDRVECKACLSNVSVPGYCAGHPSTEGC